MATLVWPCSNTLRRKHAHASVVSLYAAQSDGHVVIEVKDNGRGFDPAKLSSQPHNLGYGLSGIAERVRILGGNLTIGSQPGEGTSLTIEVPLPIYKNDTRGNSIDRR